MLNYSINYNINIYFTFKKAIENQNSISNIIKELAEHSNNPNTLKRSNSHRNSDINDNLEPKSKIKMQIKILEENQSPVDAKSSKSVKEKIKMFSQENADDKPQEANIKVNKPIYNTKKMNNYIGKNNPLMYFFYTL